MAGKVRWTHEVRAGEDYELYNHKPMFRYNAYFGIHTVHYLDLVELAARNDCQRRGSRPNAGAWADAALLKANARHARLHPGRRGTSPR